MCGNLAHKEKNAAFSTVLWTHFATPHNKYAVFKYWMFCSFSQQLYLLYSSVYLLQQGLCAAFIIIRTDTDCHHAGLTSMKSQELPKNENGTTFSLLVIVPEGQSWDTFHNIGRQLSMQKLVSKAVDLTFHTKYAFLARKGAFKPVCCGIPWLHHAVDFLFLLLMWLFLYSTALEHVCR